MAKKDDSQKPSFVTLSQFEDLRRPPRFVPRTIADLSHEDPNRSAQIELITHVREQLRKLVSSQQNWFGCSCVEIKKGDGMSWNCEAINQAVAQEFFHLKRWPLTSKGTTDSLPLIANYVQLKTFLRFAIANHLTDSFFSFFTLRSWVLPAIVLLSLVISFLIQLLDSFRDLQLGASTAAFGSVFTDPAFYLVNVGLLALGVASQTLANFMTTRTKSGSIEKLVTRLSTIEPTNLSYDRFVDDLARKLQTAEFPRVVIIDNFEKLDPTTRHVIARYFEAHASERTGSEFWIIFENDNGGDRFSSLVLNDSGPGYKRTQLYRQLLLSPAEKTALAKVLDKSQEAAEYDVVSRIINAENPDSAVVATVFKSYRDRHPKKTTGYDDLDFLFLLSLTADNVFLTQRFLINNLSEKTGLRPEVLSLYLGGSGLRIEEFRNLLAGIRERFSDVLIVEPDGELTRIKTIREKTKVLIELADELELDAGLGHLYWALFWHDKQPQTVQAMWLRKLSRHILHAETTRISDPSSYVKVRMRLFEAVLFCVDNCLKACLFNDITTLVSKAASLLKETDRDDQYERRRARLLQRCWAAYTVLGDEDILRVIVDLYDRSERGVNYHRESSLLEKMFFESMGLSPEKRRRINPELLERIYGRTEEDKPISDYVRARSSWLALAAGRLVNTDVCRFISALAEADLALPQICASSSGRIHAWLQAKEVAASKNAAAPNDGAAPPKEDINLTLTDLMSLSLSLWCMALRFNPLFLEKRFYAANPSPDDVEGTKEAFNHSRLSPDDFSQLIEVAENAALLASELKRPGGEQSSKYAAGSDYLMSGLAKELCAVSLASVLAAERYATRSRIELTEKQINDVNSVIQLNAGTLKYHLPKVNSIDDFRSEALVTKVDSLMKLCGIIWRHFGTERLSEYMSIRRVVYSALCLPEEAAKLPTHNALLQSVGPVMNRNDFAGVMANLAISDAAGATSSALAANYAVRAADFALNGDFGKPIQDQLVLNAITSAHTHGYAIDPFVKHLITAAPDQKSLLERLLLSVRDIPGAVLLWLNLANKLSSSGDVQRVLNILREFAQSISDEDMRLDVESQLELFSLRQTIKKGKPVNAAKVLANWAPRKHIWVYPSVLRLLLDYSYGEEQIKQESLAILDRVPEDDRYNTYLLLSISLARKLQQSGSGNGELRIPMSYLMRSHPYWERELAPAMNVDVYKTLHRWDPENRGAYEAEIQKWLLIDMEEEHLRRLPRLLDLGHYFFVFRYYFDTLSFWGLRTDVTFAELSTLISHAPEEKRARASAWKHSGGNIPQPLISAGYQTVVNAQFLAMGSLIFDSPCGEDPEFQEHRTAFDEAARSGLDQLFDVIINLPTLPPAIRELLQDYSRMLSSNSLPAD